MRSYCTRFLPLFAVATCGCSPSPEIVPVEGTVTLGGKPLEKIEVVFYAHGDTHAPKIAGITDGSGHYRLVAPAGRDGTVVGHYKVCLYDERAKVRSPKPKAAPVPREPSRIPESYSRPDRTPLQAAVRPGSTAIDFSIP